MSIEHEGNGPPQKKKTKTMTEAALAANRANAQKSTGANTEEGKARSKMNASKHLFFAVNPLLPWEEPTEYNAYRRSLMAELAPVGNLEVFFAERFIGCAWRQMRVVGYEGEVICLSKYRDDLGRELLRVVGYEVRLDRMMEKALKKLEALQERRRQGKRVVLDPDGIPDATFLTEAWHPQLNNPQCVNYGKSPDARTVKADNGHQYPDEPQVVPEVAVDENGRVQPFTQPKPPEEVRTLVGPEMPELDSRLEIQEQIRARHRFEKERREYERDKHNYRDNPRNTTRNNDEDTSENEGQ